MGTPQSMFWSKIRKKAVSAKNISFVQPFKIAACYIGMFVKCSHFLFQVEDDLA